MWRLHKIRKSEATSTIIRLFVSVVLAVALLATSSFAQAPGYVRLKLLKAGLMAGGGGGSGVLTYRGRNYPFKVSGASLGITAGASFSRLEGWASGIAQVSDFAGTYSSVGLGGAIVGGFAGVQLKNEKGVTIALQGPKVGMEFATNLSVVRISLKSPMLSRLNRMSLGGAQEIKLKLFRISGDRRFHCATSIDSDLVVAKYRASSPRRFS